MCHVQERPFKPMAKGQLRMIYTNFLEKQTKGRETSGSNGGYRLHIFLLLFFGEYQACLRVLIDKIPAKYKQEQRSQI